MDFLIEQEQMVSIYTVKQSSYYCEKCKNIDR